MSYTLTFEIAGLPKMPNALLGSHWRTRSTHKKRWLMHVSAAVKHNIPRRSLVLARVTCVRMSSKQPDHDGLVGSFKPILDALVNLNILLDDTPTVIGQPIYAWEKCPIKQGRIRVTIEEMPAKESA